MNEIVNDFDCFRKMREKKTNEKWQKDALKKKKRKNKNTFVESKNEIC